MTQTQCPVPHGDRKSHYPGEPTERGVEVVDGVWHVRDMAVARQVLRSRETTQAGFNAETMRMGRLRRPILYGDGTEHRLQRSAIARYFAPRTVEGNYRTLMERNAEQLLEELRRDGRADLSLLALRYSVAVAAEVVGLTESDLDGMARRLERFFANPAVPSSAEADGRPGPRRRLASARMAVLGRSAMLAFHLKDVRPAIRARRERRRDDVVSHLLDEGCSEPEILVECVTYAAAGMVTTREFIAMATWQLLDHPQLRERYLAADDQGRLQVLHELLRLDPIVGHLYRRTGADLEVECDGERLTIPAGSLVDLYVRAGNADPAVVGEQPLRLCPGRDLPPRVGPEVMSFGDGPHKCPGNALAIQEADVLLQRLLRLPVRLARTPRIGWDELITGYEVRDAELVLERA